MTESVYTLMRGADESLPGYTRWEDAARAADMLMREDPEAGNVSVVGEGRIWHCVLGQWMEYPRAASPASIPRESSYVPDRRFSGGDEFDYHRPLPSEPAGLDGEREP